MTGRDVVKFIVDNNLFDKSCISETSDRSVIRFLDYLSNDDTVRYALMDDGRERISLKDSSDTYLIKSNSVYDYNMSSLKQLDSYVSEESVISQYNSYSTTFKQWLNSLDDETSTMYRIVEYANADSNFSRNCGTFNKLMSYLESKEADISVIRSAEIAWTQYMRECRII